MVCDVATARRHVAGNLSRTDSALEDEGGHVIPSGGQTPPRRLRSGIKSVMVSTSGAIAILLYFTASVAAEPQPAADPYPKLRYFTKIDVEPYRADDGRYWFVTAQGLTCGIWFRGSFGCSGDIPGAPPDVHKIGWINGDTRVHYDWTMATRFPPPQGSLGIPRLNYIESDGTSCATTVDDSTYCERGPWRMLITPTHTWLNG